VWLTLRAADRRSRARDQLQHPATRRQCSGRRRNARQRQIVGLRLYQNCYASLRLIVGLYGFTGGEHFALRGWNPERYGTLDHPGDDISFDIYRQAARAIGPVMLGGAEARKLVATQLTPPNNLPVPPCKR
jgi:alpha/beta hydrolase family protein